MPSDGNSRAICLTVCTSGIEAGSVSRLPEWIFMPSAGSASSRTTTPETTRAMAGWRSTGDRTRPLIPPLPILRLSLHTSGTRGRSTHRPSFTSRAGSTVIEPSTAIATTRIAPVASELKVASPIR